MPTAALGEGSAQLGSNQGLLATTELLVDILESDEVVQWTGVGNATVTDPSGTDVAVLLSGDSYAAPEPGTFEIHLSSDQTSDWDVSVEGATRGRLSSYLWAFDTGGFGAGSATDSSLYVLVPGGGLGQNAVVEVKLDGFSGSAYALVANRRGVDGVDNGASVASSGKTVTPEFPLYLLPPEVASHTHLEPTLSSPEFVTEIHQFEFGSNVDGTYHLVCDLDADLVFDPVSGNDRLVIGHAHEGLENRALWNGTDNSGQLVPPGIYDCRLFLLVGEVHFLTEDVETSYEGLRLFQVDELSGRTATIIFWNDAARQSFAVTMPNGDLATETSGPAGVDPGNYPDAAVPNGVTTQGNARAWGNFTSESKGNGSILDTFGWLAEDSSSGIEVVFDPESWPIFIDGFESGSTTVWSATAGTAQ